MEGSEGAAQPNTTITRVRTEHASKDSFLTPIGAAGANPQAMIKQADGSSSFNNSRAQIDKTLKQVPYRLSKFDSYRTLRQGVTSTIPSPPRSKVNFVTDRPRPRRAKAVSTPH